MYYLFNHCVRNIELITSRKFENFDRQVCRKAHKIFIAPIIHIRLKLIMMLWCHRTTLLWTSNFVPLTNLLTTCEGVGSYRKEELLCSQFDISRQKLSFINFIREESKGLSSVDQIIKYHAFMIVHITFVHFKWLVLYSINKNNIIKPIYFKCINIEL